MKLKYNVDIQKSLSNLSKQLCWIYGPIIVKLTSVNSLKVENKRIISL